VYSAWLAKLGYQVHLIDVVPAHIKQARNASSKRPDHPFSATLGDARCLEEADESCDVILLLGPLYHLLHEKERMQALSEAWRVLRRDGVLFAAAISRFASLLDGMRRKMLGEPEFRKLVERDLEDGRHLPAPISPGYFTTAFFHRPSELVTEIEDSGFGLEGLFGVEGPFWLLSDLSARWKEEEERGQLLWAARAIEQEPSLLGASAHLLAVARKKATA
jgi:SAM-dependent methyltransferase